MPGKCIWDCLDFQIFWRRPLTPAVCVHSTRMSGALPPPVPLSDGLDTSPCKILDPPLRPRRSCRQQALSPLLFYWIWVRFSRSRLFHTVSRSWQYRIISKFFGGWDSRRRWHGEHALQTYNGALGRRPMQQSPLKGQSPWSTGSAGSCLKLKAFSKWW